MRRTLLAVLSLFESLWACHAVLHNGIKGMSRPTASVHEGIMPALREA